MIFVFIYGGFLNPTYRQMQFYHR